MPVILKNGGARRCKRQRCADKMSIYQKNLRRLGLVLMVVSILDVFLELTFYMYLSTSTLSFTRQMQSPVGICLKDGFGLITGILACIQYYHKEHARWILRIEALLLLLVFPAIIISTKGKITNRIDSLINATDLLVSILARRSKTRYAPLSVIFLTEPPSIAKF